MPQNRSSRLNSIPTLSSAVVPIIVVAYRVTFTLILEGISPFISQICKIVTRFIILVNEAIYLRLKFERPLRNFCSLISYKTQLWAETEGIVILIFLLQWGDWRLFSIDPLDSFDLLDYLDKSRLSLSWRADTGLLIRQFFRIRVSLVSYLSSFSSFPSCSSMSSFFASLTARSMELYLWGREILLETSSIMGLGGFKTDFLFGRGGIFLIDSFGKALNLIILYMRGSIRDDKNMNEENGHDNEVEKDRKIKRLTQINRELIDALKQQNEELTKKISKQRLKGGKNPNAKSTPKDNNNKQIESIRKELSNAYKQIDMYKEILQGLKAKEISLDHIDKIKDLENRVKVEDAAIENYQKEIKYLAGLKEKQEKELKIYENEEVKQTKNTLEKEIVEFKERMKTLKKNAIKREQIDKKQHSYFVQLQKALRKANDEYYPGKTEKKEIKEDDHEITQAQWNTVKNKLAELRLLYQENNKKLDLISRQKMRELHSFEQNELKLKEKMRKLHTLRSRIAELTKLTVLKEPKENKLEPLPKKEEVKNDKNKGLQDREIKKWNVPQGFSLEKGKVLPNSTFISDKNILQTHHKYKIVQVQIWSDGNGVPCLLRFIYQNQMEELIEGKEMAENIPQNLQMSSFKLKDKDYLWQISGKFTHGLLSSITFRSKLGKEQVYEDSNSFEAGDPFAFSSKPNDIPSCFYGATLSTKQNEVRICYLGCEFMSDW